MAARGKRNVEYQQGRRVSDKTDVQRKARSLSSEEGSQPSRPDQGTTTSVAARRSSFRIALAYL